MTVSFKDRPDASALLSRPLHEWRAQHHPVRCIAQFQGQQAVTLRCATSTSFMNGSPGLRNLRNDPWVSAKLFTQVTNALPRPLQLQRLSSKLPLQVVDAGIERSVHLIDHTE